MANRARVRSNRKSAQRKTRRTRSAGTPRGRGTVARRSKRTAGRGRTGTAGRSTSTARKQTTRRVTPQRASRSKWQWIEDVGQHERRPGQTLATRSHEVIRQWAEARGANPATVEGRDYGGRPGVLRLDFPDYGGQNLRHISWDDWFGTFDGRNLVFLYQEHKADGSTSNFFRLDNPEREDG